MHSLLDQLHQDHVNCARLLDVLNGQWASLANDGDADYRLVLDVLDYIEEFTRATLDTRHEDRAAAPV